MSESLLPVLIVGAGPVGLTMACELKRHGIDCRLLDQKAEPTQTSNAIGIHARSLEMMEDMGLVDEVLAQGLKIKGMHLYSTDLKLLISAQFSTLESKYAFALDLPQSKTEAILTKQLQQYGADVEREMKVTALAQKENSVAITVEHSDGHHETISARYLVAADGYHSTVRDLIDMPYRGDDMKQEFIMIDAPLTWDYANDDFHIFYHEDGPAVFFPMVDSCRTIIEVSSDPDFDANKPLSRDTFQKLLKTRWSFNFTLGEARWISHFFIHERIADHYRKDRIFLVGDAAHAHSPAGGQGMNTGMQDAYNLAWKLASVISHTLPKTILDTYEAERHPIAETVIDTAGKMTQIATVRSPILRIIRDFALRGLDKLPKLQARLTNTISGIGFDYEHSLLSKDYVQRELKAGDRTPTVIQSPHFVLMLSEDCKENTAIKEYIEKNATSFIEVREIAAHDDLHRRYQLEEGYCLIRPDQYIASYGDSLAHLEDYMKWLQTLTLSH